MSCSVGMQARLVVLLLLHCTKSSICQPGPALTPNPRAAPLLGGVGQTTVAGMDSYAGITFGSGTTIAGPFEGGFNSDIDQLLSWLGCSPASKGYLCGGIDTQTALEQVNYQCGTSLPSVSDGVFKSLMYACGVHSPPVNKCTSPPGGGAPGYSACSNPPYHFHQNFTCLYDATATATGHSIKVGVSTPSSKSITQCGIYGKWEATNTLPELDACSGHFGVTPDSLGQPVYHHHVQDKAPFAVGCYGPSASGKEVTLDECRSYYSTCGDSDITNITTTKGTFLYDRWCPCYHSNTGSNVVGATTGVSCNGAAASRSSLVEVGSSLTAVLMRPAVLLAL